MLKKTVIAATAAIALATAIAPTAANAGHRHGWHGFGGLNVTIGTPYGYGYGYYDGGYGTVCKWKKVRVRRHGHWKFIRVKKCYRTYDY
ncbi:MAG: hypothetical protein KDJ16_14625 [Hyphomicrobiales bacterium]|nr:hypothetical protein [Hyphomicrobiales bacterium]